MKQMLHLFILLAEFLGHLAVGTLMFIGLLAAAAVASSGLAYMAGTIGDDWIMYGAAFLKYAMFGIDIVVMLVFSVNAAIHFVVQVRRTLKESSK